MGALRASWRLHFQPMLKHPDQIFDLFLGQRSAAGNTMPFFKASAATDGRGVLGNEDRVASHRRLPAVVFRLGRRKTFPQKLPPVFQHDRHRLFHQIVALFGTQSESASKPASRQRRKQVLKIAHEQQDGWAVDEYGIQFNAARPFVEKQHIFPKGPYAATRTFELQLV
jgi:hypothetical protein